MHVTSYNSSVCYGSNADRDAVSDVDVLAELIEESLAELVALTGASSAAPRRAAR